MHRPTYLIARAAARYVAGMNVHHRVIHADRLARPGPFLIACTHIGHLEPVLIGATLQRPVHWVARIEFYRQRWTAGLLNRVGAIPVNRSGVPVSTIRASIAKLAQGQIVGIFPEGGRTHGREQAVHGGPIKGGVCLIAERAQVPVVPVVVLNIDAMHRVANWMPGQRITIRTIVGQPIHPHGSHERVGRRQRRIDMTAALSRAFVSLFHESQALAGGRP